MKGYEKYKDSGVEWIGKIPVGWGVKKLKYGVTVNPPKDDIDRNSSELVAFLPMEKVTEDGVIDCSIKKSISDLYNGFTCFRKNDVIVAKITPCFENGKGAFLNQLETELGFGSTEFHVLRVQTNISASFLYYVTKSEIFMKVGEAFMSGAAGQKRVPTEFIADFPLASPSKLEQTAIANYLDRKTAAIDKLIAQKERLLSLYEEEKNAIINQAVTQGINPDVRLKDSDIDWLGEIPEHWEVKRLRYIGNCQNGVSKGADYFGSGFPFISYGDVYNDFVLPQQVGGLAESTENDRANYSVRTRDVFFTRTSETVDEIGLTSTCLKTIEDAIFSGFLIRFRPNKNNLFEGFSKYYFSSTLHRLFFVKEMNLVTRASLSQELLKRLPVLLPSIQEQKQIAAYLDEAIEHLNAKITKTKKIIALQKEYRTALISEVVTGKIKVTEEMAS